MNRLLVAIEPKIYDAFEGVGTIGQVAPEPLGQFGSILSGVIGFMTLAAIVYFIFRLIIGGYSWMTAGGESSKVQTAQAILWQSVLGLTIVLLTMVFVNLIGFLLGGIDLLDLSWLKSLF